MYRYIIIYLIYIYIYGLYIKPQAEGCGVPRFRVSGFRDYSFFRATGFRCSGII